MFDAARTLKGLESTASRSERGIFRSVEPAGRACDTDGALKQSTVHICRNQTIAVVPDEGISCENAGASVPSTIQTAICTRRSTTVNSTISASETPR